MSHKKDARRFKWVKVIVWACYLRMCTSTKRSDAQPQVEYKTVAIGSESNAGECHAIAYGFLRSWHKYRFVSFTLRVMKVYQNPTETCSLRKQVNMTCADPEGGTGGPDPPWKFKNIWFLSNKIRIPWKSQSYQSSIQCRAIIGPPAKLNGVSLAGRWWPANSGIWILPPPPPPFNKLKITKLPIQHSM